MQNTQNQNRSNDQNQSSSIFGRNINTADFETIQKEVKEVFGRYGYKVQECTPYFPLNQNSAQGSSTSTSQSSSSQSDQQPWLGWQIRAQPTNQS